MLQYISSEERFKLQILYPTNRRKKTPIHLLIVDTHYNANDITPVFPEHSPTVIYRVLECHTDYIGESRYKEDELKSRVNEMNKQYQFNLYLEHYA